MSYYALQPCVCRLSVHMSTEVKFIEAFEPMTDLEDKPTHILMNFVDNKVRFIEAFEPMTDFETYRVSILVHMSTEVKFIEAFEPMTDLEDNFH